MWRVSKPSLLCVVLLGALLSSCVALRPAPNPGSSVVLSVRFIDAQPSARSVSGLIVSVDDERGTVGRQFAFVPNGRVPGSYTNFLVRLDLPAGHYRLRRLTGVVNGGVPLLDVDVAMSFEARAHATDYLGRIELRPGGSGPASAAHRSLAGHLPRSSVVDGYEEDAPDLVRAWPVLRARAIERRLPPVATARSVPPGPSALMEAQTSPAMIADVEGAAHPAHDSAAIVASAEVQAIDSARPIESTESARANPVASRKAIDKETIEQAIGDCARNTDPGHSGCRPGAPANTLGARLQRPGTVLHDEAARDASRLRRLALAEISTGAHTTVPSTQGDEGPPAGRPELVPVTSVQPVYPAAALHAGQEGYVDLHFTASSDGRVEDVIVAASKPAGVFDAAAIRAMKRWRFKPVTVDGAAVKQPGTARVRFALPDDPARLWIR